MQVGLVGLGRMGFNLALNMVDHGHQVVAYNRSPEKTREAGKFGVTGVHSLEELVAKLLPRRVVWLMLPAGEAVEETVQALAGLLSRGDIIIDGGNSHYRDTRRRYQELADRGLHLADSGTSGGIEGARRGICAMVGADADTFSYLEPLFADLSLPAGYLHTGPTGSGHFVKMVHNGIEYGMLEALGEGFEILARGPFDLDLAEVARVLAHGSVIRGWLVELLAGALAANPRLEGIKDVVHSSGEGLWTAKTALDLGIPAPVITASVFARYRSEQAESLAAKVIAALRHEFGAHPVESPAPGDCGW
ncbi:MAG: decarboxylating 6-phosphogluconate dehydrogenase [Clostridia bacterium]|nr:MAG: decarboxylating 6-phosphogluconate dehydrogenase [Clostridia bacterium]